MLVAIVSWALRYLYNVSYFQEGKYQKAWAAMPAFHFNELFIPGLAAGVLWSFANLCSILAVSALGQGLGYTLVQSSMLVSGWWGILYGEIRGSERIYKWFISSVITILGIFMVSYEHQ
jgi:glucose uptake protein GlcU